jgi:hypothetical protein
MHVNVACGQAVENLGGTMKRLLVRILFSILFIGFMFAMPMNQAFASMANASASFDWSQLSIFGSLNWVSRSTDTSATASNNFGETGAAADSKSGWVSSSSVVGISNGGAQGVSILEQSLSAVSYSSLAGTGWGNSAGSSVLTGSFTADATGWIIISVPYSVSLDLTASPGSAESAQGKAKVQISLAKTGESTSTDSMELFSTVYDGNIFNQSLGQQPDHPVYLGLMKMFYVGETGTFTVEAFTETAMSNVVPLPGALWLFAPGLACFFGLRKRLHV